MIILVVFAFLAGIVTILSPCILPILPLILSSSVGGEDVGKSRQFGVVVGFVLSFTAFTLFLSTLVRYSGISADALRMVSVVVIAGFGLSLLIPQFQVLLEQWFSKFSALVPRSTAKKGFGSGLVIGFSLGLLWTPCVGPILASVISLALTGSVSFAAAVITFAYAVGTALPMLIVMWGGRAFLQRVPWLLRNTPLIQKVFGVLMILTALAIFTNADRKFQTYIIEIFPQYGAGLTKFEDQGFIRDELEKLNSKEVNEEKLGKPMFDLLQPKGTLAPELIPGGAWLNSDPLTLSDLRGKVVVIDFWTYSCINCQRTLPYLRKWDESYRDDGLVIIGVHSPEFEFEKEEENVRKAIADFELAYPVMQDNDFKTWRAYDNRYWPAKYFIDKEGYIRYTHFGEGAYDESERVIQELLKETGAEGLPEEIDNPEYTNDAKTPETYLGYARIRNFASEETITRNTVATYTLPASLPRNGVAFAGEWSVMEEYAGPQTGAALELDFEAKDVFLVMRPREASARVRVLLDGTFQQEITVDADQLYTLLKLPAPGRHTLKIEFLDDHAELYAFTFG
jgi:cytochrome c biogenesis protein CcdA/thiol-disulfide isomerase/thioredoxin